MSGPPSVDAPTMPMRQGDDWEPPPAFGDFEVRSKLGRGGMGQVYLGYDVRLQRLVALKFISADNADPKARDRFEIEARAIARLQHQNVVSVFRIGEVLDRPYIAYEFVSGRSVAQLDLPVSWDDALHIGLGLARGLAAAHAKSVLHRDIKPANAMLGDDGVVKLIDFGLAKLVDPKRLDTGPLPVLRDLPDEPDEDVEATGGAAPPLDGTMPLAASTPEVAVRPLHAPRRGGQSGGITDGGIVLGTPLYLAPEIWEGSSATPQSDVYALGLILYELCAGRLPFAGLDMHALVKWKRKRELPPLASLGRDVFAMFAKVVDRCVMRRPEERLRSGVEVCEELEQVHAIWTIIGRDKKRPSSMPPDSRAPLAASAMRVGPRSEALAARLYEGLFAREPALRSLFPEDLEHQHKRLAVALLRAIADLNAPERLSPMLEELGRKHAAYGVQRRHLDAFGQALMDALAEMEEERWTPELARAWLTAYTEIADAVQRGLDQAPESALGPLAQPHTQYLSTGDVTLAYQVVGRGPVDLALVQGWVTHLEGVWGHPAPAKLLRGLASFSRLVLFDQRGTGMSERDGAGAPPSQRVEDLRDVLGAAGCEQVVLVGVGAGCAPCALFAAEHPERTRALILYGASACGAADDAPHGVQSEALERMESELRAGWRWDTRPLLLEQHAPSMADDPTFQRWWARYLRLGATLGCAVRMLKEGAKVDVRPALGRIRAPTLVLHRAGDRILSPEAGRDVAAAIPGARFVALPGDDHLPFAGDTRALLDEIWRFVRDLGAAGSTSDVIRTGSGGGGGGEAASGSS